MTLILILSLTFGIALLLIGGHVLVRHAVRLAERMNISPLVIGSTIVAFGTSAPELVISIGAVLTAHDEIVIGNIIGSNIANLLLVLAIPALIFPFRVPFRTALREGMTLTAATFLFIWLCLNGRISRMEGAVLLFAITGYTILSFMASSFENADVATAEGRKAIFAALQAKHLLIDAMAILGSLTTLAGGSHLFV